ncbi:uncharacterized protein LOC135218144 [Macrobrachium nipponense]|uniref:uncharacterized protein LOC135218144 n=1 Tax=Macrobrachium nipponense TaxID=159736 RepID=UPI0030C7ED76
MIKFNFILPTVGRAPLPFFWALLATWIIPENSWAQARKTSSTGSCVPCNSTLNVDEGELPSVGFICPESFPSSLPSLPFECLAFFPQNYSLTLHLHEFYLRNASVSVCTMIYYEYMKLFGASSKLSSEFCWDLEPHENKRWSFGPLEALYINITIPTSKVAEGSRGYFTHLDFHTSAFGHEAYRHRQGFNFTYEIRRNHSGVAEAVEGLSFAHLTDCSFNGIPELHKLSRSKYRFRCRCLQETSGDHCQWGGRCRRNGDHQQRLLCSTENSTCRHIDGQDICSCPDGYRGRNCDLHYTTISAIDNSCGGILNCQHHCHLRILVGQKEAYCSCKAGYNSLNETHCVPSEDWDVLVLVRFQEHHNQSKTGALTKIKQVLQDEGIAEQIADAAVKVQMKTQELICSLDIKGLYLKNRLMDGSMWQRQFPEAEVQVSAQPKLTVGPVSAEFDEAGVLLLACPVYGGKTLEVSWYKDGYLLYTFNVSDCLYDQRTSRLLVATRKGIAEHACTVIVRVLDPEEVDHGTYTCRVTDRHYVVERNVFAGTNDSLHLELRPYTQSINKGDNASLDCLTINRGWIDVNHYVGHWKVVPEDGFSKFQTRLLPRRGFRLDLFNITKNLEINCMVREQEDMDWIPGTRYDSAIDVAAIRVITQETLTCPERREYGTQWHLTPVNKEDVNSCPKGYKGKATRWCKLHLTPFWDLANFSSCIYGPLEFIKTQLLLYGRGYKSIDLTKKEEFVMDFQRILEEHSASLLPGEGRSVLDIINMFQRWRENFIPFSSFFRIIQTMIKEKNALLLTDTWRMVDGVKNYLTAYMKKLSPNENANIHLPHLAVKVQTFDAPEGRFFWSNVNPNSSSEDMADDYRDNISINMEGQEGNRNSHYNSVNASLDDPQERNDSFYGKDLRDQRIAVEIRTGNVRGDSKGDKGREGGDKSHTRLNKTKANDIASYGIGVVAYIQLSAILENSCVGMLENKEEVTVVLRNPLVEIVSSATTQPSPSRPRQSSSVRGPLEGLWDIPATMLSLIDFRSPDIPAFGNSSGKQMAWQARCGKAELMNSRIVWNLAHCELRVTSRETFTCLCRDHGLFTLLLAKGPLTPETHLVNDSTTVVCVVCSMFSPQKSGHLPPSMIAVGLCCSLSVLIMLMTVTLLSHRFKLLHNQIHMIKCTGYGAANLLFASVAWWSIEGYSAEIMAGISSCLAMSIGVGISQQLVLYYHLTDIPNSSFFLTVHLTTALVFLLSMILGILVWGVQNIHQYAVTSHWMPVGEAWPLSTIVMIWLLLLSTCNTTLFLHNVQRLGQLHFVLPHPETTNVLRSQVQRAFTLVGELVFLCSSFFHNHPVGRFFFSAASVVQSIMLHLEITCAGDDSYDLHSCLFQNCRLKSQENEEAEDHIVENGVQSCMGTLMKCRLPPSDTYAELTPNGNPLDDESSEFRARGGSFWSQSTTILQLSENGETLQSPTDSIPPLPFDFSDPEARNDVTACSCKNELSRGAARHPRGNGRFNSKKKCMSFSLNQPVIHEFPTEICLDFLERPGNVEGQSQKYLDMSVTERPQQLLLRNNEPNNAKKHLYINAPLCNVIKSSKKPTVKIKMAEEIRHYVNATNERKVSTLQNKTNCQHLHIAVSDPNPDTSLTSYQQKLHTIGGLQEVFKSKGMGNYNSTSLDDSFIGPIYPVNFLVPAKSFSVPDIYIQTESTSPDNSRGNLCSAISSCKNNSNEERLLNSQGDFWSKESFALWLKESSYHLESLFQRSSLQIDGLCSSNDPVGVIPREQYQDNTAFRLRYFAEKCRDMDSIHSSLLFTKKVFGQTTLNVLEDHFNGERISQQRCDSHSSLPNEITDLCDRSMVKCSCAENFFAHTSGTEKHDSIHEKSEAHFVDFFSKTTMKRFHSYSETDVRLETQSNSKCIRHDLRFGRNDALSLQDPAWSNLLGIKEYVVGCNKHIDQRVPDGSTVFCSPLFRSNPHILENSDYFRGFTSTCYPRDGIPSPDGSAFSREGLSADTDSLCTGSSHREKDFHSDSQGVGESLDIGSLCNVKFLLKSQAEEKSLSCSV